MFLSLASGSSLSIERNCDEDGSVAPKKRFADDSAIQYMYMESLDATDPSSSEFLSIDISSC